MSPLATLPREALLRLVTALVADEIGRQRGRPIDPAESRRWTAETVIDEDGLGADSLSRLELVARLADFLHMRRTGAEDYLLVRRSLGDWAEIAGESLARYAERVTFRTSGSTGRPRRITHETADLSAEVEAGAALFPGVARVVALTPPHHIYGFLWSVLFPARAALPVLDARGRAPSAALAEARPGDLIVATPFLWDLLLRSGARAPEGVTGLTSTAPAPPALWAQTRALGLARLVELYGSTETVGVGWREAAEAPFALMGHLARGPAGAVKRARDGAPLTPPDALSWEADGRFRPMGRRDGAVQVGGVNVWPERVRAAIRAHPAVADCAVRPAGESGRLKAFVVPADPEAEEGALAEALTAYCAVTLTPPERPLRFTFGAELPRSEIGKIRDWIEAAAE